MLRRLSVFLEMIRFSHTIFALPFAVLAASLASSREGGWRGLDVVGILLCMVFARSAAMGFNRWADRDVDAKNPRTADRAIPAGKLTASQVAWFTVACSLGFVASTSLFWFSSGNPWPLRLAVPVLAVLLGYSYTKRFTAAAHAWLGLSLGLAPVAAWIAIRGTVELPAVLIGAAVLLWVTGFDILYACQDLEVDRRLGLHSVPAKLGFGAAMWLARSLHGGMIGLLVALGVTTPELGWAYGVVVASVGLLLIVEHWLVRGQEVAKINLAFFHVNAIVSVLLLAGVWVDLYLPLG